MTFFQKNSVTAVGTRKHLPALGHGFRDLPFGRSSGRLRALAAACCVAACAFPGVANATRTMVWAATATSVADNKPIDGVVFRFVLTDYKSGKVTEQSCVTSESGSCLVEVEAEVVGFFDRASSMKGEVTFKKEGFLPLANIRWEDGRRGKIANFVLTPVGYPEEQERLAKLTEERIRREIEEEDKQRALLRARFLAAEQAAMLSCSTKTQCEKMFALTEIYITEHSSTKIQLATPTTITTYGPSDDITPTLNARRVPGRGDSSVVSLSAVCKPSVMRPTDECVELAILKLNRFRSYISDALKN
jgi:hypothetical protein